MNFIKCILKKDRSLSFEEQVKIKIKNYLEGYKIFMLKYNSFRKENPDILNMDFVKLESLREVLEELKWDGSSAAKDLIEKQFFVAEEISQAIFEIRNMSAILDKHILLLKNDKQQQLMIQQQQQQKLKELTIYRTYKERKQYMDSYNKKEKILSKGLKNWVSFMNEFYTMTNIAIEIPLSVDASEFQKFLLNKISKTRKTIYHAVNDEIHSKEIDLKRPTNCKKKKKNENKKEVKVKRKNKNKNKNKSQRKERKPCFRII